MKNQITPRYWREVYKSAEKRKIELNLTEDEAWEVFLQQEEHCFFSGLHLDFDSRGYRGSASLDRVNSLKDYSKDNIQWVFCPYNGMKGGHNNKYFIHLCDLVTKNQGLKPDQLWIPDESN